MPDKIRLDEKIISTLHQHNQAEIDTWELADLIYDRCMQKKLKGNGGRIAAISRAANLNPRLYLIDGKIGLR